MNRMGCCVVVLMLALVGCAGKENLIVLMPDADGTVGAMELTNDGGSVTLAEAEKAIVVNGRQTKPSTPVEISAAETRALFQDALRAQPLAPQSFLLYFEFGTENLTAESRQLVEAILQSIQERDSQDISVIGHTDRAGDYEYNLALSLTRAESVRNLLVERGVSADYIQLSSHGEGNPLVPTADNVAEARNRRVEVMVR